MENLIPAEVIERKIFLIRGQKVMLDYDLAELYGVPTKILNKSVKRNANRFPTDFMFQLSFDEAKNLRFQIGTSSFNWGGKRYLPFAFTEQGVAMLSSVLRSQRAVQVNIAITRAFVKLRSLMATHEPFRTKLADLEKKYEGHDHKIKAIFTAIHEMMTPPKTSKKKIGFARGFTLLELIIAMGMIGLFAGLWMGSRSGMMSFVVPFEKQASISRIRSAQLEAIQLGQPKDIWIGKREIHIGPSGLPQPGSSGTFPIGEKSGIHHELVFSSMGRIRLK